RGFRRNNTQCEVFLQFFLQTVVDMTRGHKLTFFTKEWRVIDREQHVHRWLVDVNNLQLLWVSKSAMVSPISKPSIPTTAQISPAFTSDTLARPKPSNICNSLTRDFTIFPSRFTKETG